MRDCCGRTSSAAPATDNAATAAAELQMTIAAAPAVVRKLPTLFPYIILHRYNTKLYKLIHEVTMCV